MERSAPWGLVDVASVRSAVGPGDLAVAKLSTSQQGNVTASQLDYLGVSRSTISTRVEQGRLHRVHHGVYLVGHLARTDLAHFAAAVLALGPSAVLSHRSAAVLWELLRAEAGCVHVSMLGSGRGQRPGICVHRTTALTNTDFTRRQLIPVTSPARTILDVAEEEGFASAERALNQARIRRLALRSHMAALYARTPGRRGWKVLLPLMREDGTDDFSRSEAEKVLNRLIKRAQLPAPRRNRRAHGIELDFFWPEVRLNVELDGYQWHSARSANNSDRDRDTLLASHGIQVIRFSRDQLRFTPEVVVARLAVALALAEGRA